MYILRDEVLPENVHLFRDRRFHGGGPIWVSNALREAMVAQGITNPSFSWGDRVWHTMALEPQRRRRKQAMTIRVLGYLPPSGRAGDTTG